MDARPATPGSLNPPADWTVAVADRLDDVREEWQGLAALGNSPFSSWEWASIWWRHFGREREPLILVVRDGAGAAVAIVPLYREDKGLLRTLRFIGHFPADELGPVCAPEHAGAAMQRCRGWLDTRRDWDLLLAERLAVPDQLGLALKGRRIRGESMPELRLETADWDQFLAGKSSNFRGQVRTKERRLQRDADLSFRLAEDPERLAEDMATLFDLHRRAWEAKGEQGAFSEELASFHAEFARAAMERGWLRLWIASLDGAPAAAWYGFRRGGVDSFYQGGRDPARERDSIGFVLMAHTLRDAVESGVSRYRLLLGAEEYKRRFSSHDPGVETVAATRGLRGDLAVAAMLGHGRLRARRSG